MKRLLTVHDSSNVKLIGYDQTTRELDVVYRATPDVVYRFQDVTAYTFCAIISADSVGTALATAVKSKAHHKHALPNGSHNESHNAKSGPIEVVVPVSKATTSARRVIETEQQMSDEDAFNAITNRPKTR